MRNVLRSALVASALAVGGCVTVNCPPYDDEVDPVGGAKRITGEKLQIDEGVWTASRSAGQPPLAAVCSVIANPGTNTYTEWWLVRASSAFPLTPSIAGETFTLTRIQSGVGISPKQLCQIYSGGLTLPDGTPPNLFEHQVTHIPDSCANHQ
jgi:hypothetical protein